MSNSKAIGQFFGAFDPVNWHRHVIGGMDSINKPRRNLMQTVFVQKPVQFGLSVLAIGSGALAIIREILCALGKLFVIPLTLAFGTVRVLTWSEFAQPLYNHLPGIQSLVLTAHRVMLQFTGIICSALGGAFSVFHGTRFAVKCQIALGNYERSVPEKKIAKPVYGPPPAAIEPAQVVAAAPHVPPPVTYEPSIVINQPAPAAPLPAPAVTVPPAIQLPGVTPTTRNSVIPAVNPKDWWLRDSAAHQRIRAWVSQVEKIAVPETPGLQVRLEALNQIETPAAEPNRTIKFHDTHDYQVETCPRTRQETMQFLKNLAQGRSSVVVTLSDEGEHWWKLLREATPLPESSLSMEWEKDAAGHNPAEVLPAGTASGSQRIIKRMLVVKQNGQEIRRLTQYHYEGWRTTPDPARLNLLIDQIKGEEAPIVVQCADGRGASGVFIACHWLKYKVEDKKIKDPATVPRIKIEKIILQMRTMRPGMVHEPAHLQAIYKTLAKRFTPYRAVAIAKAWTPATVKNITNIAFNGLWAWWKGKKAVTPIPPPPAILHA